MKNRPEDVRKQFKKHEGQLAVSSVTVGELVFGAEYSQHVERNLTDIAAFTARLEVLPFDI
jgi:tRNA(fMet)-specific endonuclease VapC